MTGRTTEGMRWAIHRPWLSQRTQSERGERRSEGEGLKARLRAEKYICSAPEGKKVFPLGTNGGFTLGKVHRPTMNSSFLRQDANVVIIPGTLFAYTVQTLRPPRLSLLQQRHSALEISDRPCSPFVKLCASSLYLLECRNLTRSHIELANIHTRLSIRHSSKRHGFCKWTASFARFGSPMFLEMLVLCDLAFGYLAASRISVIRHLNAPQNALAEVRPQAESPAVSIVVHSSILCPLLDAMVWHQPWVALLRLDILILCPRTFRVLFSIHAAA